MTPALRSAQCGPRVDRPLVPAKAGTQLLESLDSRIGVRKHAVLRTAMRGNERRLVTIGSAAQAALVFCCRTKDSARFCSSCGETSSLCVAMNQLLPEGSFTPPLRSP